MDKRSSSGSPEWAWWVAFAAALHGPVAPAVIPLALGAALMLRIMLGGRAPLS